MKLKGNFKHDQNGDKNMGLVDDYFNEWARDECVNEYVRYCMKNSRNVIYPIYKNKFFGFLYRKTNWKCFLSGWKCGDKEYPVGTPFSEMRKEEPQSYVVFRRYKELLQDEERNEETTKGEQP